MRWWRRRRDERQHARDMARLNKEMGDEIMIEIGLTLEEIGCRHGHSMAATPPMMYAEWLCCVVQYQRKKAVDDLVAELHRAAVSP